MNRELLFVMLGVAALLGCVGVYYGVTSTIQSISLNKGRQRFKAYLYFGTAVLLASSTALLYESALRIFEVRCTIVAAQDRAESKGHRTYFSVRLPNDAEVNLNAGGANAYFKPGQLADIRYQDRTGAVLKAIFLSPEGKQVGIYQGTDTWFHTGDSSGVFWSSR